MQNAIASVWGCRFVGSDERVANVKNAAIRKEGADNALFCGIPLSLPLENVTQEIQDRKFSFPI